MVEAMAEKRLLSDAERLFVEACHEAWHRRLGQLGERARRERLRFADLVDREFERVRVSFVRCKNAVTFRETLVDFWARAGGPLEPLQSGWVMVLPMLDDSQWRKARDLALLALVSYRPHPEEEPGGAPESADPGRQEAGE